MRRIVAKAEHRAGEAHPISDAHNMPHHKIPQLQAQGASDFSPASLATVLLFVI
jgi:hypothetical protein